MCAWEVRFDQGPLGQSVWRKCRMPKSKCRKNDEAQMTKGPAIRLRHLDFEFGHSHSDFDIRHLLAASIGITNR